MKAIFFFLLFFHTFPGFIQAQDLSDEFEEIDVASLEIPEGEERPLKALKFKDRWNKREWQLHFYFNPTLTYYLNSDVKIKSDDIDGELKDAQILQRHYFRQFNPKNAANFIDFWRFVDEPTNKMVLELEKKDQFAVGIMYFHPKITFLENGKINRDVEFEGNMLGEEIDGNIDLEEYMEQFRLTAGFANVELYADKVVPLARFKKGGGFDYRGGVGAGMYVGYSIVAYTDPDTGEKTTYTQDSKIRPIGFSASLRNQLMYTFPRENISVNGGANFSGGILKYKFADEGFAKHRNMNVQISFGFSWSFLK